MFFLVNFLIIDHLYWGTVYCIFFITNDASYFGAAEELQEHDHQIPETLQGNPLQLPSCHNCNVTADLRVLCIYKQEKNIFRT